MKSNVENGPAVSYRSDDTAGQARLSWRSLVSLLLLGSLGLTALELIHPHFFLFDDNAVYHLPRYEHTFRSWSEDLEPALLDFHQFSGTPHLALGQSCVFYPPVILAVAAARGLGDLRWAIDFLVIFHLLAGAIGMAYLLRFLGASERFSLLGALIWLFLPYPLLISRSWIVMTYAVPHVLWGLLLFLQLLREPTRKRWIAVAILKTSFVFAGYPQMVLDASLVEGFLVLIAARSFSWSWSDLFRRLKALAAAALLTSALSAPLVLPMVNQFLNSVRSVSYEEFVANAIDPSSFALAQVFIFKPKSLFQGESSIFYFGIPLLLALISAQFLLRGLVRGFAFLSLIFFLASTELLGLTWGIPMISLFRWPVKHFLFFAILAVPPAIFVLERLSLRAPRLAWLLLVPTLLAGPAIASLRGEATTLGRLTLERRVEALRELPLFAAANRDERFVTFYGVGPDRPSSESWTPLLLTNNLASLLGVSALGGYEPLVAEVSAANVGRSGAFPAHPEVATPAFLRHLATNGVGNVVAPAFPSVRSVLVASGMRLVGNFDEVDLYRLDAVRPIVEVLSGRLLGPPSWGHRSVDLEVEGPASVRIALSVIPGWQYQLDGQDFGMPASHPEGGFEIPIPAGSHRVHLVYEAPGLRLGSTLAAFALLTLLVGAWIEQRKKNPEERSPENPEPNAAQGKESELQEVEVRCNLCGGERTRLRFVDTRDLAVSPTAATPTEWAAFRCTSPGYGIHPPIVECLGCGLVYANPRPSPEVIRQAYADVEDPLYLEERRGREITFDRHLKAFELRTGRGGGRHLLDVGAYVGVFVECARDRGWDAIGLEPSAWAVEVARKAGLEMVHGNLETHTLPLASFDAVTMWDVIEHLEDPKRALEQTFELLRPGGWVAVHTMDLDSLFAKITGKRWPWLMEMHIYFFTRTTLRRMLEEVGFEEVELQAQGRFIRISYLLTRIGALAPSIGRILDSFLKNARLQTWTIPINFGDLITATARKPG